MAHNKQTIATITHPWYDRRSRDWEKFRFVFKGGEDFVDEFLVRFSIRESIPDFDKRREITYPPTHAKAVIKEIRNSIFQRMVDITRTGGPDSYTKAIAGENKGVDLAGNSMNNFIGLFIIDELMALGRVGVFIDKPSQLGFESVAETSDQHPYLYFYITEDIRSWRFDQTHQLTHLLLRDTVNSTDSVTGLVDGDVFRFRLLRLIDEQVHVDFFDSEGKHMLPLESEVKLSPEGSIIVDLPEIPFVFFQITESLLTDIADYQIALLNLGSSDMNYSLKANFPFYTEQYDAAADLTGLLRPPASLDNTDDTKKPGEAAQEFSRDQSIKSGPTVGRKYGKGLERPGFINPSPEPLIVSMQKQKELREEIRQLANLNLNTIRSRSAESKEEDERQKEEGLSAIGLELEAGERSIARIWNLYETSGKQPDPIIAYPNNYDLRTDEDRRKEADQLTDMIPRTPSQTLKKELAKESATVLVGHKISTDDLDKIHKEIDAVEVVATDPEVIRSDAEAGFVGNETASLARGYPKGEVDKANEDHAERAARIALAQSKANQQGVADMDENANDGSTAREGDSDSTLNDSSADSTRGTGQ